MLLGKKDSPFAVEVDLMTPLDPEKSPKVHVPPLNHFGLWVDDLEAAVASMEKSGTLLKCIYR
jgi:lactoylglutathione lyase